MYSTIDASPPAPPIRVMSALACDLRGLGVTSGMSAMAGERYDDIAISTTSKVAIKPPMIAGFALMTALAISVCA